MNFSDYTAAEPWRMRPFPVALTESPRRVRATALFFLVAGLAATTARGADLLDTAERSGSFKNFLEAVRIAGLTRQLKSDGPYTVFMPTDLAFRQITEADWASLKKKPQELARILRYHMIRGRVKVTEVKPGPAGSIAGPTLELKSDNGMVTVNGARVTESDLQADNGIIHGVDSVLTPPEDSEQ